uniref:Tail protein n=2 Tax=viral metagenome TaxID=1070528 RepID=A0A6H1ZI44_9ZZZZ
MASQKYRHMKVLVEGLPILEATEAAWSVESNSQWVETKDPGLLKSNIPPKVSGSLTLQIPRGGHEYDYTTALVAGNQLLVQVADADGVQSARVRVSKMDKSDRFAADRTCTVSFDGYLVP